jgi:hypothetical protein
MRYTADVAGGKPIAVRSQSISDVSAINPLVAFLRHPWKKGRGTILLFCPGRHTRFKFIIVRAQVLVTS